MELIKKDFQKNNKPFKRLNGFKMKK